jgi:hypothetical protein
VRAPDLPALARKIALVVDREVGTLAGGEACLETLKRDARRLAYPPASVVESTGYVA